MNKGPINKLIAAHKKARKVNILIAEAIRETFPIGSEACHTKGGNLIRVQVENVNSNSIKVRNPKSGKSQWVHYFHFFNTFEARP